MADFTDIDEARKTLGLSEAATMKEMKKAYREMAKRYHPDKHGEAAGGDNEEMMKKLNWAYKMLMDYCKDYKYSFKEEDIAKTYPEEEYMRRWRKNWFDSI